LAVHTSSSRARLRNDRASFSILFGLLSLAAIPAAWYAAQRPQISTAAAVGGEAVAGSLFGLIALILARRARYRVERTLGRVGEGSARWGRLLGLIGLCLGLTAAIALAVYAILLRYES